MVLSADELLDLYQRASYEPQGIGDILDSDLGCLSSGVNDVPTIGHLKGIRSTTPRRAGIHAISIAADDLCARVFGQPANQRFRGWVLKQVDDVVVVTVDHNRAVAAPATKGEFIDPEDLGCLNQRFG